MPSTVLDQPRPDTPSIRPASAPRWGSLDVLRGVALYAMVVHHLLEWTGGDARERIVGFEGLAITDLAAPVFAVGLGAAAHLVSRRIVAPGGDRLVIGRRSLERWLRVLLAGLVIDVAVGGGIDGG
ncbi:MAG TPA: heparan-alpha-glucosaminide N-acetyltransferase domain-containing protein, partial [Acidimicrobiales bacterium]